MLELSSTTPENASPEISENSPTASENASPEISENSPITSKNPFPEIQNELQQWSEITPHSYAPIFEILGNFYLFGVNYLYPIICLRRELADQIPTKIVYDIYKKDASRRNLMCRKYLGMLLEGSSVNDLVDKIDIDIVQHGFWVIVPDGMYADCMTNMQKVIEKMNIKEYLIRIKPNGNLFLIDDDGKLSLTDTLIKKLFMKCHFHIVISF